MSLGWKGEGFRGDEILGMYYEGFGIKEDQMKILN